jgi:hypothetical protein
MITLIVLGALVGDCCLHFLWRVFRGVFMDWPG